MRGGIYHLHVQFHKVVLEATDRLGHEFFHARAVQINLLVGEIVGLVEDGAGVHELQHMVSSDAPTASRTRSAYNRVEHLLQSVESARGAISVDALHCGGTNEEPMQ